MERTEKISNINNLKIRLESGKMLGARNLINNLHPSELARLIESLPLKERAIIWELIELKNKGDVVVEVADEVRDGLIEGMNTSELLKAIEGMALDDLADLVTDLPETLTQEVIRSLDHQDRERLKHVLTFDENSAGGLMNIDIISVRPDITVEVVLRYLRNQNSIPTGTDSIYVVNRNNIYKGALLLSRLVTEEPSKPVAEIMSEKIIPIPANTPSDKVVWEFENRDLLSAPVIDQDNKLLGRITIDDVVDVIRDEAEHSLMSAAGLDEEDDLFSPATKSAKRRAIWLGVNLATAFLAASVVDLFQTTLDKIVLLAVLMPIVPSMGGVAGSQSLTIITRAIALGNLDKINTSDILRKEVLVGILNGMLWATVVGILTYLWFDEWLIGIVIAGAMSINLFVAALAGFSIPLILKKLNIDPALAGGVVLTTVTDVIGYISFLGLGAIFLL
tara:strand:+ start:4921 stop:6267 length:1347 start_codon:yes stop_codon:yes gene_type:complete